MTTPGAHAPDGLPSLGSRTLRGLTWLAAARTLSALALLALPAVLARLLDPTELGLVEIAIGVLGLSLMLVELGSGPQIVQRPLIDERFLATVFWVNVSLAGLIALLLAAGVTILARLTAIDARLVLLLYGVAGMLVPLSFAIVPRSLLTRQMRFRPIAVATVAAGAGAIFAGGAVGRWGIGPSIAAAVTAYVVGLPAGLVAAARWQPRCGPDRSLVKPLLRYSASVSAAATVADLVLQVERWLIIGLLGPAALGVFGLARTLMRGFPRHLLGVVDGVMLPGLAELQHRLSDARRYYLVAVRAELAVFGPLVVFAAVFAQDVVAIVFGPGWEGTAALVPLLAPWAWRGITGQSVGTVFLSLGRPDLHVRWAVLSVALVTVHVLAGAAWGLVGIAISYSLLETIGWSIGHAMANRLLGLPGREFAAGIGGPARTQLLLAGLLIVIRLALTRVALGPALTVAVAMALGLPIYLALFRWSDPALWKEMAAFGRPQ